MNSDATNRQIAVAGPWQTFLGFIICCAGIMVALWLWVKEQVLTFAWKPIQEWLQGDRLHKWIILIILTVIAFVPGLFCLFYYVAVPDAAISGFAAKLSWWWVWIA